VHRIEELPDVDVAFAVAQVAAALRQILKPLTSDPPSAINALNALSHAVKTHSALAAAVKSDPELRGVTGALFEAALSDGAALTQKRVVTTLAAAQARIGCYCRPFWDGIAKRGPPDGPVVAASLLCHCAQLVTLHRQPPPSPELLAALCRALRAASGQLNSEQILMAVSALSKLRPRCTGYMPNLPELLDAIHAKAAPRSGLGAGAAAPQAKGVAFKANELVIVIKCLVRLRWTLSAPLAKALAEAALPALHWVPPPEAAGAIRTLAQLNVPLTAKQCAAALTPFESLAAKGPDKYASSWDTRPGRHTSRAQDASSILHALAALPNPAEGPDEGVDARCLALLEAALAELPSITVPGLLAGYLTSLARIAAEWPAAHRRISLPDVYAAVLRCADSQGPQAVSNTLFAFVVLTATPSSAAPEDDARARAAADALRLRALRVVREMVPTSLTKTLWALSFLDAQLSPPEREAYHLAVQSLSPHASPNFFAHGLSSLAALEPTVPAATARAVLAGIERNGSKMVGRDVAMTFAALARLGLLTHASAPAVSALLAAVPPKAPQMSSRDLLTVTNVLGTHAPPGVDIGRVAAAVAALHAAAEAAAPHLSAAHFAGLVRSLAAFDLPLERGGGLRTRLRDVVHRMHSTEAAAALYAFVRVGALLGTDEEAGRLLNMAAKQVEYVRRKGSVRDLLLGLHALGVPLRRGAGAVVLDAEQRVPGLSTDSAELRKLQGELEHAGGADDRLAVALAERWDGAMASYDGRSVRSAAMWRAKERQQGLPEDSGTGDAVGGGSEDGNDSDSSEDEDEGLEAVVVQGMPQGGARDRVLGGSWEQAGAAVMLALVESDRSLRQVARAAVDSGAMHMRSLRAPATGGGQP
jgi:hypothetical protein